MSKNEIALKTPKTDISVTKAKEIQKLHKEINAYFLKGAKLAFQAGELLYEIQIRTDAYQWKEWVENSLDISLVTVNRYITIYMAFKDNKSELENTSMKDALNKAALEFVTKKPSEEKMRHSYGNPGKQIELDWETIFSKSPVSKAKLKNYRFECPDQRSLWLVKRGINYPVKFMDMFVDPPKENLIMPYQAMMKVVQGAVEMYFEKVEQIETADGEEE